MSNTAATLGIIAKAIAVVNGLINLSENAEKYRKVVAQAIAEGRDITDQELDQFRSDAAEAIAEARKD